MTNATRIMNLVSEINNPTTNADEIGVLKLRVLNLADDMLSIGDVSHLSGDCKKRQGYENRNGKFIATK